MNSNPWDLSVDRDNTKPCSAGSFDTSLLVNHNTLILPFRMSTASESSRPKYSDGIDNFDYKRDTSDLSRKRAKTDSSQARNKDGTPRTMSPTDLALVDEEMRMIAVETESTSTGYHSDKSSPQSPVTPVGADRSPKSASAKSRTKTSVTSISIDNQRAKALVKRSSRSSLWAPCSNSIESTAQSKDSRDINKRPPKKLPAKVNKGALLTKSESEQLENEILQPT